MKPVNNNRHPRKYKKMYPLEVHIYVDVDDGTDAVLEFHQKVEILGRNTPLKAGHPFEVDIGRFSIPWKQLQRHRVLE